VEFTLSGGTLKAVAEFERGALVTVAAFGGVHLLRRVWDDSGEGILLCSEQEYQRALASGDEPLFVGFPKASLVGDDDARSQI